MAEGSVLIRSGRGKRAFAREVSMPAGLGVFLRIIIKKKFKQLLQEKAGVMNLIVPIDGKIRFWILRTCRAFLRSRGP